MNSAELAGSVVFHLGPLPVTDTVATTWGIIACLAPAAFLASRRLKSSPGRWQAALEGALIAAEAAIAEVVPGAAVRPVLPFVATLWLFILVANLVGLVPGLHAPTRDLSLTAALALLVFLSTHWFGIRSIGWRAYLRHYIEPSPILLPFHVISEFTRTLALAIRLFGNIMSLEMAAMLMLLIAGFLVPVPLLLLHLVEALVQAYIFGMLALIYIAGAMERSEDIDSSTLAKDLP
ncbi:F0F1 ATP synthase subunit A [Noviherbaspirillum sp. UKPF54]|uniref:F0F1 ATP synthase subunit A n=1 Tax=Noviherbaspirillum sp. UKPF54 TaxID=2601898 RepID=UPI0011B1B690|nr:F0F1 ATP synthase subunit A [Noviherbaspirillum sp. UKPF54]QDZ27180.1 F0F1 ATP synthase subunit A [Noviherbaspirillum sp. UKPF54]